MQGEQMTTQTASLQHPARAAQRVHHYAWSSRHANSLRAYDHRVEAGMPLSLPVLGTTGEPTRILIVDDVFTTGPLEYLLHGLGYWTTRVALCGETALQLAQDFLPSVVLLSLELPDMSAYRVAARLRDRAVTRDLRLIALTGEYAHTSRDLAREAGFERYLAKPVNVSALLQLLSTSQH
jgi:CheY-like chemotaxis protein